MHGATVAAALIGAAHQLPPLASPVVTSSSTVECMGAPLAGLRPPVLSSHAETSSVVPVTREALPFGLSQEPELSGGLSHGPKLNVGLSHGPEHSVALGSSSAEFQFNSGAGETSRAAEATQSVLCSVSTQQMQRQLTSQDPAANVAESNSHLVEVAIAVQPCNHGHEDVQAKVDKFLSLVVRPLPATVVQTPAPRRRGKIPAIEDWLPRRSRRVAAQSKHRVSNPEVQAQNVLMRKLGITSANRSPDADALKAYDEIYRSPLGSVQCRAIRALFTVNCPQPSVEAADFEP
jgi:hypothetical protein